MSEAGQHEAALALLSKENASTPTGTPLRAAILKEREATVRELLGQADLARRAGRLDEQRTVADRIEAIAPGDSRAAWLREDIARAERHKRLMGEAQSAFDQGQWGRAETVSRTVLEEDPRNTSARILLTKVSERRGAEERDEPVLAAGKKRVSIEFRDASLRTVFDAISRASNINFVFDKDVRGDSKVSLTLRNVGADEAIRIILATQQLDQKLLNENSILIYPNNAQKQREHQELVTRNFYLVSADAKQTQTLVRTMMKTKDLHVDERMNLLIVRDTPQVVRAVERLVESVDLPEAEVMLEVEVLEVSTNLLRELGLSWPTTLSYGIVPPAVGAGMGGGYISSDMRGSLRAYTGNPLVAARVNGTSGSSNLLANPRIRARNHEKARVQIGNKLPVFTTTTTGAGSVAGFIASSVTYLDVGLKLEVEPSVLLDNDIILKVALEVSSVAAQVAGPDGSTAYNVGTRQTSTSIRLRDGETEVLAGLIQDDERKTAAGVPGLSEMPLLGSLFGVRANNHGKTEIIMLITPRIIRNASLPPVTGASSYSGTEAQPGAPALRLRSAESQARMAPAEARSVDPQETDTLQASDPVSPLPPNPGPSLTGPTDAEAGSSIEVTINNPGPQPMTTELNFDTAVFQAQTSSQQPGRISIQVPGNGSRPVNFMINPQIRGGSSSLTLTAGGSLTVHIRPKPGDLPPPTAKP